MKLFGIYFHFFGGPPFSAQSDPLGPGFDSLPGETYIMKSQQPLLGCRKIDNIIEVLRHIRPKRTKCSGQAAPEGGRAPGNGGPTPPFLGIRSRRGTCELLAFLAKTNEVQRAATTRSQTIHTSFTNYSPIFFITCYTVFVARKLAAESKYITPSLRRPFPQAAFFFFCADARSSRPK